MADNKSQINNPHLVLPAGTQVVTRVECRGVGGEPLRRSGTVGKIVKSPTDSKHSYLIAFPDGGQARLYRQELAIRKHVQGLNFERPEKENDGDDQQLRRFIIYKCIVGSKAFGLDLADSDTDVRGIFLPPAELHWSLYGLAEQIENDAHQECYWELQKFLVLALKANPNVLECLYTPLIELTTPLMDELLAERSRILSKLVYQTYNGYVLSQFKKLEQDLRTEGDLKWKHVMHLVRLLASGVAILEEGIVPVGVELHRERLLAIRHGEQSWDEVNQWRLELHKDFASAYDKTKLPERPDYQWANDFLIKARKSMVSVSASA